jgi:RNA polymerase sigma factor (TIGR02999 family)
MRQPPDTSGIDDVTALLQRWREPLVRDQLFARIYPELKRVAGLRMRRERPDHTLQPTALVNEVFLVLVRHDAINCHDRAHFLAIASTAMRRILVDHARNRSAQKRASGLKRVPDDPAEFAISDDFAELVEIDDLLEKLAKKHARVAQVVELRYFGGLTFSEVAEVLGVNERTVKRDWEIARGWIFATLHPEEPSHESPDMGSH